MRLHPLSLAEVGGHSSGDLATLLQLSGFPEPFLGGSDIEARRWSLAYRERMVREEVISLESISDLNKLELLANALPARVGSPLSINALRDIDGREVDFVLTDQGKPIGFVECKWDDAEVSSSLRYLRLRFPAVPAWQVSAVGKKDFETPDGIRVAPAVVLLRQLV